MSINLYTSPEHYHPALRTYLHPLLRPFIGKPANFTDADRRAMYGLGEDDFKIVTDLHKARVAILPMAWNYYHYHDSLEAAFTFYERSRKAGLTMFSWNAGDFGVRVPDLEEGIVHRQSGYRSKLPPNHRGMPVFISDPLKHWYGQKDIFVRSRGEKPVVGFCGQVQRSLLKYTTDVLRTGWRNTRYHLRLSQNEPQWLYPSTLLRNRALASLERDLRVKTNFIKRTKYRAGVRTEEERQKTTLEFYDNMVESDSILCVRGGGNFSVRLYETLAMGRIPLFLNTDCLLPLPEEPKWKSVIVEAGQIDQLPNKIVSWYSNIGNEGFTESQKKARDFWLEQLSLKSFFVSEIHNFTS